MKAVLKLFCYVFTPVRFFVDCPQEEKESPLPMFFKKKGASDQDATPPAENKPATTLGMAAFQYPKIGKGGAVIRRTPPPPEKENVPSHEDSAPAEDELSPAPEAAQPTDIPSHAPLPTPNVADVKQIDLVETVVPPVSLASALPVVPPALNIKVEPAIMPETPPAMETPTPSSPAPRLFDPHVPLARDDEQTTSNAPPASNHTPLIFEDGDGYFNPFGMGETLPEFNDAPKHTNSSNILESPAPVVETAPQAVTLAKPELITVSTVIIESDPPESPIPLSSVDDTPIVAPHDALPEVTVVAISPIEVTVNLDVTAITQDDTTDAPEFTLSLDTEIDILDLEMPDVEQAEPLVLGLPIVQVAPAPPAIPVFDMSLMMDEEPNPIDELLPTSVNVISCPVDAPQFDLGIVEQAGAIDYFEDDFASEGVTFNDDSDSDHELQASFVAAQKSSQALEVGGFSMDFEQEATTPSTKTRLEESLGVFDEAVLVSPGVSALFSKEDDTNHNAPLVFSPADPEDSVEDMLLDGDDIAFDNDSETPNLSFIPPALDPNEVDNAFEEMMKQLEDSQNPVSPAAAASTDLKINPVDFMPNDTPPLPAVYIKQIPLDSSLELTPMALDESLTTLDAANDVDDSLVMKDVEFLQSQLQNTASMGIKSHSPISSRSTLVDSMLTVSNLDESLEHALSPLLPPETSSSDKLPSLDSTHVEAPFAFDDDNAITMDEAYTPDFNTLPIIISDAGESALIGPAVAVAALPIIVTLNEYDEPLTVEGAFTLNDDIPEITLDNDALVIDDTPSSADMLDPSIFFDLDNLEQGTAPSEIMDDLDADLIFNTDNDDIPEATPAQASVDIVLDTSSVAGLKSDMNPVTSPLEDTIHKDMAVIALEELDVLAETRLPVGKATLYFVHISEMYALVSSKESQYTLLQSFSQLPDGCKRNTVEIALEWSASSTEENVFVVKIGNWGALLVDSDEQIAIIREL